MVKYLGGGMQENNFHIILILVNGCRVISLNWGRGEEEGGSGVVVVVGGWGGWKGREGKEEE